MHDVLDVRQKQRAVIEFLVCENEAMGNIHKRLQKVYGEETVDRSKVCRWAQRTSGKGGHANICDLPRSGRPQSARTDANVETANNMIKADRRITVKQLSLRLDISDASVCRILEQSGFSKVRARWVPRQLTDERQSENHEGDHKIKVDSVATPTLQS
ncbi:putative uncharacterized protein FLJ37770 [Zootermopsis nevadensis]|uniref:putative uncharacterized protein FLJ37770 n=1 Tax=Zootermopsis nevadensis TaxID=136037 RepID=UPI000B8E6BF9|nr:putative uncharacterized protein FLJ37770 [Zootermopsis nevadensis]